MARMTTHSDVHSMGCLHVRVTAAIVLGLLDAQTVGRVYLPRYYLDVGKSCCSNFCKCLDRLECRYRSIYLHLHHECYSSPA
ncbi:hypothetical protein DE146DRAFT_654033 [Phaeosphaeria sp. MPI-PUGE-AT-0046c]|nr:hypothetical protein DE146DRAFT_654033 [Phaeosphaeria sp. MPI-PUGE-AT-0046c]